MCINDRGPSSTCGVQGSRQGSRAYNYGVRVYIYLQKSPGELPVEGLDDTLGVGTLVFTDKGVSD